MSIERKVIEKRDFEEGEDIHYEIVVIRENDMSKPSVSIQSYMNQENGEKITNKIEFRNGRIAREVSQSLRMMIIKYL